MHRYRPAAAAAAREARDGVGLGEEEEREEDQGTDGGEVRSEFRGLVSPPPPRCRTHQDSFRTLLEGGGARNMAAVVACEAQDGVGFGEEEEQEEEAGNEGGEVRNGWWGKEVLVGRGTGFGQK